jgi:hypothetical protein
MGNLGLRTLPIPWHCPCTFQLPISAETFLKFLSAASAFLQLSGCLHPYIRLLSRPLPFTTNTQIWFLPVVPISKSLLAACPMLIYCLAYYSTLKIRAICTSEMTVYFHGNKQHYPITQKIELFIVTAVRTSNQLVSIQISIRRPKYLRHFQMYVSSCCCLMIRHESGFLSFGNRMN